MSARTIPRALAAWARQTSSFAAATFCTGSSTTAGFRHPMIAPAYSAIRAEFSRAGGTWRERRGTRRARYSLSLQWRHMSGVKLAALDPKFNLTDKVSPANTKLGAQDYLDVAARLQDQKAVRVSPRRKQVLDRQPPLVVSNTAAGGGPVNGNTYPEWYDPLGRYIFASAVGGFRTLGRCISARPATADCIRFAVAGSVQKSGRLPVSRQYLIRPMRAARPTKPGSCRTFRVTGVNRNLGSNC